MYNRRETGGFSYFSAPGILIGQNPIRPPVPVPMTLGFAGRIYFNSAVEANAYLSLQLPVAHPLLGYTMVVERIYLPTYYHQPYGHNVAAYLVQGGAIHQDVAQANMVANVVEHQAAQNNQVEVQHAPQPQNQVQEQVEHPLPQLVILGRQVTPEVTAAIRQQTPILFGSLDEEQPDAEEIAETFPQLGRQIPILPQGTSTQEDIAATRQETPILFVPSHTEATDQTGGQGTEVSRPEAPSVDADIGNAVPVISVPPKIRLNIADRKRETKERKKQKAQSRTMPSQAPHSQIAQNEQRSVDNASQEESGAGASTQRGKLTTTDTDVPSSKKSEESGAGASTQRGKLTKTEDTDVPSSKKNEESGAGASTQRGKLTKTEDTDTPSSKKSEESGAGASTQRGKLTKTDTKEPSSSKKSEESGAGASKQLGTLTKTDTEEPSSNKSEESGAEASKQRGKLTKTDTEEPSSSNKSEESGAGGTPPSVDAVSKVAGAEGTPPSVGAVSQVAGAESSCKAQSDESEELLDLNQSKEFSENKASSSRNHFSLAQSCKGQNVQAGSEGTKPQHPLREVSSGEAQRISQNISVPPSKSLVDFSETQESASDKQLSSFFEWKDCTDHLVEVSRFLRENFYDETWEYHPSHTVKSLEWSMKPPGVRVLLGVKSKTKEDLLGFVSAVSTHIWKEGEVVRVCTIRLLCVHRNLRKKTGGFNIGSCMIAEVKRRFEAHEIFSAVYSADKIPTSTSFPKPLKKCYVYCKFIEPKKLKLTEPQGKEGNKPQTKTSGLRKMKETDVGDVTRLLQGYLEKFKVATYLTEKEVSHWMVPRKDLVYTYVVESPRTGSITDFFSFYREQATVVSNDKSLKIAYAYYNLAAVTKPQVLMKDMLSICKKESFDLFAATDTLENSKFLSDPELGFEKGDDLCYQFLHPLPEEVENLKAEETAMVIL